MENPTPLTFPNRAAFRTWLAENIATGAGDATSGVWLLFGKKGGPITLKANEALEEALCFGWIDGQMQSLSDTAYQKYFARRTANSNWSEKNKALAAQLEEKGLMTDAGRAKIAEAKANGQWETSQKATTITPEHMAQMAQLLAPYEPAYTNLQGMSPSVQKTYARAYFDAKSDATRQNRLRWMVERLNKNLKPM